MKEIINEQEGNTNIAKVYEQHMRLQEEQKNRGNEKKGETQMKDVTSEKAISEQPTAVIGVGQAGANIAAFISSSCNYIKCFGVNTSEEDLIDCIDDLDDVYIYDSAKGSGKERQRSKNIFINNASNVYGFVKKNCSSVKNIVIIASAGGGTGGGSAPMFAKYLQDNMPDKNIFLMIALGSVDEDIKSQMNMKETLVETIKAEVNYLIFDCNKVNDKNTLTRYSIVDGEIKDAVEFISRHEFKSSEISNIDIADMEKLYLDHKRMVSVTGQFNTKLSNTVRYEDQMIQYMKQTCQLGFNDSPMAYAIYINADSDVYENLDMDFKKLIDTFGESFEIYKHLQDADTNETQTFTIVATGLEEPVERYNLLNKRIEEFNSRKVSHTSLLDVDDGKSFNPRGDFQNPLVTSYDKKSSDNDINNSALNMF